jgi:hypothetical protein
VGLSLAGLSQVDPFQTHERPPLVNTCPTIGLVGNTIAISLSPDQVGLGKLGNRC